MYEVEKLIGRVEWIRRYKAAPFLEERNSFLLHLHGRGFSARQLKVKNKYLLGVVELIDLGECVAVDPQRLERAATEWVAKHCRTGSTTRTIRIAKNAFTHAATNWLRFMGRWIDRSDYSDFEDRMNRFMQHLQDDRGYTAHTVLTRQSALRLFFAWLASKDCRLEDIGPATIATYFVEHKTKAWTRATIKMYASSLQSFFHFAVEQGWCRPGIEKTIDQPRMYSLSGIPQGPTWNEVQQLLASVSTDRSSHIRDRAIILLLTVYGLRIGEVARLTLEDIDWHSDRIRIHRLKRRTPQEFPLVADVGNAIVRYLKLVRPKSTHRQIFLRLHSPHQPFTIRGLSTSITLRIRALGLKLPSYGPHSLRHACATHLLSEGFSIKGIGDHLGHRSAQATQIYAKVDERRLREVATVSLGPLAAFVQSPSVSISNEWAADRLLSLREVADVRLGGLL